MIAGKFHQGSGLGDQLMRYITVRTLAEAKGYEWGMIGEFKGQAFMPIKRGTIIEDASSTTLNFWNEKDVRDVTGVDIRSYDPEINFVENGTLIDGCFEDEKYWGHNLDNIREWLRVEPLEIPDDVCIIGFRGGEYAAIPDLFLPHDYYFKAIKIMREKGINKFEIHTDDTRLAKQFFSYLGIDCIHDIGLNWRSVRYAKHAIIANSAFYIIPRLLSGGITIAPRYWARRNIQTWARPACYYKQFTYL